MIINCICGKKKFRLSDELMPSEGSKVRCGACSEVWFYHPDQEISLKLMLRHHLHKIRY